MIDKISKANKINEINSKSFRKNTDSAEQSAAIQAPANKNMIIVAGAGSGKTYTMTRRVIDLIDRGIAPESILGLTFTNKAASELLARVAQAVSQHCSESQPTTATSQSQNINTSNAFLKPEVMTYDAFFQSIVRQYGLLVGFDQNTQPLSDAGARELIKPLVNTYVTTHPEVLSWYSFDALIDDVLALAADISCSMIGVNSKGESLDSTSKAVLEIQEWNNAWIEHLQKALNSAAKTEIITKKPSAIKLRRGKNDTDEKYFEKCVNYGKEYVEYLNITLKNTCYDSCNKLFETAQKRAALLDLVLAFDAAKKSANMAQFSDFTIAAYRLVTNFPSIAAQYRRQYSQVLLDEYQDTSTTQAMLIATLFHNESSESSESVESSASNSSNSNQQTHIAAVGDPFQAIYSFRGASSGAFRKLEQVLNIGSETEFSLTQTRRNSKLILQAANAITKPLRMPALRKSSALSTEVEVKNLQYLENAPNGMLAVLNTPTQYQEIEAVVRFVNKVKNTALCEKDVVNSENSANSVSSDSARVAVLFRSKTNIALYEEALQQAGLRTLTVGYSALLEKPEVKDVLSLLAVSADHTNTSALMRLLATPRFSLNTDDLKTIANIATSENIEYIFRALVQAGLADPKAPREKWAKIVQEQQSKGEQTNSIHGGVFIADVLLEAYADPNISNLKNNLSAKAYDAVLRLGQILDAAQRAQSASLHDIVRTAIESLNIDIDVAVSNALMNNNSSNATLLHDMRSTSDAIFTLADSYLQEMSDFTQPTLRGFMDWVQNIDKIDDQPASVDEPADVVLMTIHQSKGLEWPAVAIVGLNEGAFPSNQGDGLRVKQTQQNNAYFESAYATLEIASKVPVPMRVDADILPRFPHDADLIASMNPQESLRNMESVEKIDAEIYGSRAQAMLDLVGKFREYESAPEEAIPLEAREVYDAAMKTGTLPLSQVEERGRALHIDERHLMYVALTRAKFAALVTCSQTNAMSADSGVAGDSAASANSAAENSASSRAKKPSVFWNEMNDAIKQFGEEAFEVKNSSSELGYVVGDLASDFAKLFSEPSDIPSENRKQLLAWPNSLTKNIRDVLRKSADITENLSADADFAKLNNANNANKANNANNETSKDNLLLSRAQALVQDADLMPQIDWYHNINALKNRAEQLSKGENVNVTAVQRRATFNSDYLRENKDFNDADAKRLRNEWMAIIRPIPRISSPTASLGTRFHAWAEQFVKAGCANQNSAQYDVVESISEKLAQIEKITQAEKSSGKSSEKSSGNSSINSSINSSERKLLIWEKRLATSKWAHRRPIAAEQPIVAHVPELGDQIINGKLDAVFAGGLDENDPSKIYTVVDWKTGKKPTNPQDIALKLGQLDWYRLLLSLMTNVPLEAIDATLYYVNIADECEREIHAEPKTKDEILAELHSDTLISLDDDDA